MSHPSNTLAPSLRRDLLSVLGPLALAVFVFHLGHVPGAVNSATLIAMGAGVWACWNLVMSLSRNYLRFVKLVRCRLRDRPFGTRRHQTLGYLRMPLRHKSPRSVPHGIP